MADSLSNGHKSPRRDWSASCSPYCSLGTRWRESRTGCPAFLSKFIVIGGKEQSYNPKLTAARVALAKTESEIEKLLDTLSGANPLLLQYANNRIEELDAERQKQLKLVADLTANSVSASQIDSITGYLDDWESVSFDDKRKVVDILISQIDATSEEVTIHWKI